MNKKNICIVFDLDDTLYLEREYVSSGFRAVEEWCIDHLGLNRFQEQAQQLFDEGHRGDIFNLSLDHLGVRHNVETISTLVRIYREHVPNIKLPPDALDCLTQLQGKVHLGLLTDGNPASQWAKIDALGLRQYFDTIVVTGDWGIDFSKPHARGYQYLESESGMSRGQLVYIGDNPSKDFVAPRILGWNAIRVRRPAGLHEIKGCPSDLVCLEVPDLETIPELVFELCDPNKM